ncbi:TPA: DNA polymerase IV [Candidatus Bipolaricaulota bacterium]|nr:DNA polymerase IV [Candidatus Bipolaricaulota bacterium]
MARKIVHVDMDAFYAAIEQLDHPELRGKPVIVGGDPEGRGVVSTASYEAREFGVHSAMPAAQARRLCPQGIFLRPRFDRYREVSRQIREILYSYTPLVEPISLDEAFLDLTGTERLLGPAEEVAREIKQRIFQETGLTCSVGLAPSKFLAKLASSLGKPDGFVVVPDEGEREFLRDLPVECLRGVGEVTTRRLRALGIRTVGQLRERSLEELSRRFGSGVGRTLYELARGIDRSPVLPEREARSLSAERTFPEDLTDWEEMEQVLFSLSEELGRRLRAEGLKGRTVQLKVRFADFSTITRARTLIRPTDLGQRIFEEARKLLMEKVKPAQSQSQGRGIRLLGVQVSGLIPKDQEQLPLFSDEREERTAELERLIDELRERFGEGVIRWGRSVSP